MSFSTERAEKFRRPHPAGFSQNPGDPFGWFEIPTIPAGPKIRVQASAPIDEGEFEHVSVSLAHRCPTWEEMCKVKDLFWEAEDVVVQYHPAKSEYVNTCKTCLHLWRWTKGTFPQPNKSEVDL
jgi:hypothetical protein